MKVSLTFPKNAHTHQIYSIAEAAGLNDKAQGELADCWDMVQIWWEWFEGEFGKIKSVWHRSAGDDPPDLELVFANQVVPFEHTRFQPQPLGHVQALKKEGIVGRFGCVVIPALANPLQGRDAAISAMRNLNAPWDDVSDELDAIRISLSKLILSKRSKISNGVLGIVDRTNWRDSNDLFEIGHDVLNSQDFADSAFFAVIILSRRTPWHSRSALIRRGKEMRKKSQPL